MTRDDETIAFYNKVAESYAKNPVEVAESERLRSFAKRIRLQGDVLDLGCGFGNAARAFHATGFNVTAFDASDAILEQIRQVVGVTTICADFDKLDMVDAYDGIWANFCLQHVPRAELPQVLDRIINALRTDGWLLIGIHEGTETRRDKLGRLYCHYTEAKLTQALLERGVKVRSVAFADSVGYDGTPFTGMTIVAQKSDEDS